MVLANLYLLFWNYDRLKFILPGTDVPYEEPLDISEKDTYRFPGFFFAVVGATVVCFLLLFIFAHKLMPRNNLPDCEQQFRNSKHQEAGSQFCDCIHQQGRYLHDCLEEYEKQIKK